jgi:hypothetical protein
MVFGDVGNQRIRGRVGIPVRQGKGVANRLQRGRRRAIRILIRAEPRLDPLRAKWQWQRRDCGGGADEPRERATRNVCHVHLFRSAAAPAAAFPYDIPSGGFAAALLKQSVPDHPFFINFIRQ